MANEVGERSVILVGEQAKLFREFEAAVNRARPAGAGPEEGYVFPMPTGSPKDIVDRAVALIQSKQRGVNTVADNSRKDELDRRVPGDRRHEPLF